MSLLPILNDSFIKQVQYVNQPINFELDNQYCLISISKDMIIVSFIIPVSKPKKRICRVNFYAMSCNTILSLIVQHHSISDSVSFSHALYIGKEIYKAELSNIFTQKYIQS